jgi:hypothetical protein
MSHTECHIATVLAPLYSHRVTITCQISTDRRLDGHMQLNVVEADLLKRLKGRFKNVLIHQPTYALNKIYLRTSIRLQMFRQRGAIIRELFRTKKYKPHMLIQVLCRPYWNG